MKSLYNGHFSITRFILSAAVLMVMNHSVAQTASIESKLLSCAEGSTDRVRLACYDGLADSLRGMSDVSNAGQPAAIDGASVMLPKVAATPTVEPSTGVPVSNDRSASSTKSKSSETFDTDVAQKQSIRVMVEKTKRNSRGDWYFYFDNGEVWKQIDSRGRSIPSLPLAATVSRGIFSSYKLHIDGQVWSMKVRRVK